MKSTTTIQILYTTNLGYVCPDSFTYTISDGQANASGSASPIEGSEAQFEFLHTLIPAGESAQKIFDRPMGGSWNYTQGVYAFGEVAFPSTSFTFIRHAFDLAGNRKLQLKGNRGHPSQGE